jgi:16S rRNA (guanine(527)-N(7))-methyltransferase RsmG
MTDPWEQVGAAARALHQALDPGFEPRVRGFLAELDRWSRTTRLTGYRDEADRIRHLVLDSLLFLAALPEPAAPLLDVGSGAGAPGLVLKLARPAWAVVLVEANRRRANFLRHVLRTLALPGAEVREGRAEALAREAALAGTFMSVTARAVAAPATARALVRPFLRPEGWAVVALGSGPVPAWGTVREVRLDEAAAGLRIRRRFLIIRAAESPGRGHPDVPRETEGAAWPGS